MLVEGLFKFETKIQQKYILPETKKMAARDPGDQKHINIYYLGILYSTILYFVYNKPKTFVDIQKSPLPLKVFHN